MPFYQEIYTSFFVQLPADHSSRHDDTGPTSIEFYLVMVHTVPGLPRHLRQPVLDPSHRPDVEYVDVVDKGGRAKSSFSPSFPDVKFDRG